jgi:uncharacterized protein YndB with AHSA1/START domain
MSLEPIKLKISDDLPQERAFELFADRLGDWCHRLHLLGAKFDTAQLEPRSGGRWFERTQDGDEIPWGAVRAYERSHRLVLQFGIGADRKPAPPARSSEVELRFTSAGAAATRVSVEHRDFERHGDDAAMLREGMASESQGWPVILAEFRRAAGITGRR